MPLGVDIGASADTLATTELTRGRVGPKPEDGRIEIRWGRLDGHDVVVKAGSAALRERLRREAEVLRRMDGAPAVELVELVEGADHTELVTTRFGSLTLAETGLLDPWECGSALVASCNALEALHASGWAGGTLAASHVLVDPGNGVRFCSLGDASETETPEGRTALATDRDALASIVVEVLERPPGFDSPRVRRLWRRAARKAVPRLVSARGLRHPEQIREILTEVNLPGTEGMDGSEPDIRNGHPKRRVLAAASALALVSGTVAWLAGAKPPEVEPPEVEPSEVESSEVEIESPCADVDGDGSCESVNVEGQELSVDGRLYSVGNPGDVARLGDWNCDGRATVALLRPSSGQVFQFDGWSTSEGTEIEGRLVGRWPGADRIAEQTSCGAVQLDMRDGSVVDTSGGPNTEEGG